MDTVPQRNIMKTGEWSDADAYRVACECHDPDHDLSVWIEVEPDSDVNQVTLTFYKELTTPIWDRGFNRLREACRVLFLGHSRYSASIMLDRKVAENLLHAVQSSIDRLDKRP